MNTLVLNCTLNRHIFYLNVLKICTRTLDHELTSCETSCKQTRINTRPLQQPSPLQYFYRPLKRGSRAAPPESDSLIG